MNEACIGGQASGKKGRYGGCSVFKKSPVFWARHIEKAVVSLIFYALVRLTS